MITSVMYPIIYARDIATAEQFYTAIGFAIVDREGDFTELSLADGRIALNRADNIDRIAGHQTLAISSDNIDEDYARIARLTEASALEETSYGKTFIVRDPDGNKVEIIEAAPSRPQ